MQGFIHLSDEYMTPHVCVIYYVFVIVVLLLLAYNFIIITCNNVNTSFQIIFKHYNVSIRLHCLSIPEHVHSNIACADFARATPGTLLVVE